MLTELLLNKWIEALRSGNYKQTYNRLCKEDCFCVLGVLGDVLTKEKPDEYTWFSPYNYDPTRKALRYKTQLFFTQLPLHLLPSKLSSDLVLMNDEQKQDFKFLAMHLEMCKSQLVV
jgi:hypothetical protein